MLLRTSSIDVLGLEAFVSIATAGSFARAAEILNVTSPALTRRLLNLEAQPQVQLLERTTRAVSLTPAGENLLPRAQHLLDELSITFRETSAKGQAQRGTVTLACVPTVGVRFLPALLREYSKHYPGNRVRILDHASYGVAQAAHMREAEFGISMADAQFSELDTFPVLKDLIALICRRDHSLASRRKLNGPTCARTP
jgi:DNA-binding transcriptional LysR family regulator